MIALPTSEEPLGERARRSPFQEEGAVLRAGGEHQPRRHGKVGAHLGLQPEVAEGARLEGLLQRKGAEKARGRLEHVVARVVGVPQLRIGESAGLVAPHQVGRPALLQQLGQIDAVQKRVEVAHEVQRRGDRVSVEAVKGTEPACNLVVGKPLLQLACELDAADEVEAWEEDVGRDDLRAGQGDGTRLRVHVRRSPDHVRKAGHERVAEGRAQLEAAQPSEEVPVGVVGAKAR